jgi:hypothetical protein
VCCALFHTIVLILDKDDSGSITYDEFLVGIRGVLNKRRRELVHMAFAIIDKDGSGIVTIEDIQDVYNAKAHPMVIAGQKTEADVLLELLDNFDVGGTKDGQVTVEEFESYYSNVSASVDNDDYFELMMRNAWHISGGEGWCANTTNKRVLVTHADGRQTVEEVKNDIGLANKDKAGLVARLRAQGINAAAVNTTGSAGMDQDADPFSKRPIRNLSAVPITSHQPSSQSRPSEQQPSTRRPPQQSQPTNQSYAERQSDQQQQQYLQSQRREQYKQQEQQNGGRLKPMSLSSTMGSLSSQGSRR